MHHSLSVQRVKYKAKKNVYSGQIASFKLFHHNTHTYVRPVIQTLACQLASSLLDTH